MFHRIFNFRVTDVYAFLKRLLGTGWYADKSKNKLIYDLSVIDLSGNYLMGRYNYVVFPVLPCLATTIYERFTMAT